MAALAVLAVFVVFTGLSAASTAVHASLTSAPSPATGKAPLTVVFDGSGSSSSVPLASWSLDFGDGSSTSGTLTPSSGISHDYAVGTRTATLTVTDDDGDSDTASITVTSKANVPPTANLTSTPSPAVGLAPLGVTFHGTGSSDSDGSIASWSLEFGDGTTDASGTGTPPANTSHQYSAAGSYTATLTVTDDDGASNTDTVAVKVNVPPVAGLTTTPSPATGKAPLSVTFNGSSSSDSDGTIASWSLAYGDGNSTSGSGAPPATIGPHSYAAATRTAVLTVTDNNGATDTASVTVTSNANVPPVAHLSAAPSTGNAPLSVTFNGSTSSDSDGTIASWSLNFGDGSAAATGTGLPPVSTATHSYAAGTFTAVLTVTDNNGATDTDSTAVDVNAPPTARMTTTPSSATGKAPLSVTFNASTSSDTDGTIASWSLSFGDGSAAATGSGQPPTTTATHSYAAGTYTATLTVTDNDGATSAPKTIAVTSNANVAPTARMTSTPSPATGKAPLSVTFNGSSSSDSDGVIASWTLDFGDNTTPASGLGLPSSVPHTYAAGNWTATLTVSDDNGVSNSTTIAVTVAANVAPTARLTTNPSPATGKAPLSVSFNGATSSDSDGTIASWSLAYGDGATAGGSGPVPANTGSHSYAAGSYTAVLTVTDNNGATGTASVPVSVNAPPVARLFVNNNKTSGPAPLAVTFDASQSTDADGTIGSWSIDFGDNTSTGLQTSALPTALAHTYAQGSYIAKLTVTDNLNASATANAPTITVAFNNPPTADLRASVLSGTVPVDVTFDASHSVDSDGAIASWSIDFGDGSSTGLQTTAPPSALLHTYANPGTFTASLTVSDGSKTGTNTKIITVNPLPTLSVSDVTIAEGDTGTTTGSFTVSLSAASTRPVTFQYDTASGTATEGVDYTGLHSTFTINPGTCGPAPPACTFPVQVIGDTVFEDTETFTLNLTNVVGATVTKGTGTATITDNDPKPLMAIRGGVRLEPDLGHTVPINFTVKLCKRTPSPQNFDQCVATTSGRATTVDYSTADAIQEDRKTFVRAGVDYIQATGTLTIPAGQSEGTISVLAIGNNTHDPIAVRFFFMNLRNAVNADLATATLPGTGDIIDDDAPNPPVGTTGDAAGISTSQATVGATVNPVGQATTVYIEYGLTTASYSFQSAKQTLAADSFDHPLSFGLTGLSAATTYHYRVVAVHSVNGVGDNGTGYGLDKTFTTGSPPPPPPATSASTTAATSASASRGQSEAREPYHDGHGDRRRTSDD